MKNYIINAAAAAMASLGVSGTQAADLWSGQYVPSHLCYKGAQCRISIAKKGANYAVNLIVADAMDGQKIKCKLSGSFKLQKGSLVGKLDGSSAQIVGDPSDSIGIYGQRWSDHLNCDFMVSNVDFQAMGE